MALSETLEGGPASGFVQNVVVMRHGDRIDNFEPLWLPNAARPWDPPLIDAGKIRAWCTGKKIRREGFPIHRVFVSPFLRCVQTAAEAVKALCAIIDDPAEITSEKAVIDPSRVKVSIEYGLCEVMSREARIEAPPKDGKWFIDISEIEAIIPAGTMDYSVEPIYHEPPKWEEDVNAARQRYKDVIIALANKYPGENLLLVSHGEGVGVSVSSFKKGTLVYEVEYCAYSHLHRSITHIPGQHATVGVFQVVYRERSDGRPIYEPGVTHSLRNSIAYCSFLFAAVVTSLICILCNCSALTDCYEFGYASSTTGRSALCRVSRGKMVVRGEPLFE